MSELNFLNDNIDIFDLAKKKKHIYKSAKPFSHIVLDNFFKENILNEIINDFPSNLDVVGNQFNNVAEKKLSLNEPTKMSSKTNNFINYLNSQPFLEFLQELTSIKEKLIPDPYLIGGGLHELRNEGYLNIHADFNLHPFTKLDRRLNVLIYLNKDWLIEYGGSLELWDRDMKNCIKQVNPIFNRMVIFSTTDTSYHGNPQKINCPTNTSRKSIALYYYSNGRPNDEKKSGNHSTIYKKRPNTLDFDSKIEFIKLFGKFYFRKKNKLKNKN